jgi:hypothetical protein
MGWRGIPDCTDGFALPNAFRGVGGKAFLGICHPKAADIYLDMHVEAFFIPIQQKLYMDCIFCIVAKKK